MLSAATEPRDGVTTPPSSPSLLNGYSGLRQGIPEGEGWCCPSQLYIRSLSAIHAVPIPPGYPGEARSTPLEGGVREAQPRGEGVQGEGDYRNRATMYGKGEKEDLSAADLRRIVKLVEELTNG